MQHRVNFNSLVTRYTVISVALNCENVKILKL